MYRWFSQLFSQSWFVAIGLAAYTSGARNGGYSSAVRTFDSAFVFAHSNRSNAFGYSRTNQFLTNRFTNSV
ncbi:hypothetical protein BD410DRAFT_275684 [Rickenella mellea]|uniref:Secreted protein n=1 Tax=Rickenella mellea TaxID=50990 RepID=A0A4Y7Q3F8_9AGAM|nr:hypothetical protein BD410DRAFT_275684 [Rickenella mellea]